MEELESQFALDVSFAHTTPTKVLAAIAMLHVLLYKHRVLICSHTNIAIDNAVVQLADLLRKHGRRDLLDEQQVVRIGNPHLALLETDAYRNVTMAQIVNNALEMQREQVIERLAKNEDALPKQRAHWAQRKKAISLQRTHVVAALETLEAQEQERLAPIMRHLSSVHEQARQVKDTMSQARARFEEDEQTLKPLILSYQAYLETQQTTSQKLARLRAHHPVLRFFLQLMMDEWEKDLDVTLKELSTSLEVLANEIVPLQHHQVATKQTYDQAVQQQSTLKSECLSWTEPTR